ncbi:hypothetical protein HanIR_Chr01g0014021 [Helianthus annuus]|nr:hypothetical protein HanIR_Chr01g0014021 [Helianthus annuus]
MDSDIFMGQNTSTKIYVELGGINGTHRQLQFDKRKKEGDLCYHCNNMLGHVADSKQHNFQSQVSRAIGDVKAISFLWMKARAGISDLDWKERGKFRCF